MPWWVPWTLPLVGIGITWWLMRRAKAADAHRAATCQHSLDDIRRDRINRVAAARAANQCRHLRSVKR